VASYGIIRGCPRDKKPRRFVQVISDEEITAVLDVDGNEHTHGALDAPIE
jgi:hypothetical protein